MNAPNAAQLLREVIARNQETFAIVARFGRDGEDRSFFAVGESVHGSSVVDLTEQAITAGHPIVLAIPYGQIRERGFQTRYTSGTLIGIECDELINTNRAELLRILPNEKITLESFGFDLSDEQYMAIVQTVIDEEIGTGEGANFVFHRSYRGRFEAFDVRIALTAFRRLLTRETGTYWTFLVKLPDRYLIGASPELHIAQDTTGIVKMNPISGTLRFENQEPTVDEYLAFLRDAKEQEELLMVVDEELKTMSRIGNGPPQIKGPFLKKMSQLAHTEYLIEVHSDLDAGRILRESLLAPTVTGSPLENAFRVIARHELADRAYYSGVLAVIDPTRETKPELDSAIVIRTADVDLDGQFTIPVGATVVRHSDPRLEALETRAKVNGLLQALTIPTAVEDPQILAALQERNADLARFWIDSSSVLMPSVLVRRKIAVVDYEDRFTDMLGLQLESLGFDIELLTHDVLTDPSTADLTILGPGPGDPTGYTEDRINHVRHHVSQLLASNSPFLAICLSHQILCATIGFQLLRLSIPNQGTQRTIDLHGDTVKVAFYNTYTALSDMSQLDHPTHGSIQIARLDDSAHIIGLRANRFESFQFHPESLLSVDGHHLLRQVITRLMKNSVNESTNIRI